MYVNTKWKIIDFAKKRNIVRLYTQKHHNYSIVSSVRSLNILSLCWYIIHKHFFFPSSHRQRIRLVLGRDFTNFSFCLQSVLHDETMYRVLVKFTTKKISQFWCSVPHLFVKENRCKKSTNGNVKKNEFSNPLSTFVRVGAIIQEI